MLSKILSRFGRAPRPVFAPPTIEQTHWYVVQPLHEVRFEDQAWGQQWCEQQGMAQEELQCMTVRVEEEKAVAQDHAVTNMLELAKKGHLMSTLSTLQPHTRAHHLDNALEAFKVQPAYALLPALLTMAFSVNRIDVAHHIAKQMEESCTYWLNPLPPDPYQNPSCIEESNLAFEVAFEHLMDHPTQMQWMLSHAPALRDALSTPQAMARLDSTVARFKKPMQLLWPLVAQRVFNRSVSPVTTYQWPFQDWPLKNAHSFNMLMLSYAGQPAAQCTLMYQAQRETWFTEHESMDVSLANASPFVSQDAIALRQLLKKDPLRNLDPDVVTRLALLEMVMHGAMPPQEFYAHAQSVFAVTPASCAVLELPVLEHNP